MRIFHPHHYLTNVQAIDPHQLKDAGIKLLLLDRDNTLIPRSMTSAPPEVTSWVRRIQELGIVCHLVSNNGAAAVSSTAQELSMDYSSRTGKPLPVIFWYLMRRYGCRRSEVMMVGDQLFTDVLGAKLAGITGVLVTPQVDFDIKVSLACRGLEQRVLSACPPPSDHLVW